MRNTLRNLTLLASLVSAQVLCGSSKAQTNFTDVKYWVGSGSDSAVLVVDFHDQTWDTCYVWGYLFNGTTTGEDMLNNIAAADTNFSISITSGFLNDVIYHRHAGLGGQPDYWSTWSGQSLAGLSSNGGIATTVNPGDWFACSYTDFNPAIPPGAPIPAFDSAAYSHEDPTFWVGTGTDTTILVIDFLDGTEMASFAWGYLHNGTATGEDLLSDVAAADPNLTVNINSGFLTDIIYDTYTGVSGAPNYWGTWSATNLGNWDMNAGPAGTTLGNGEFFGCSYTDWAPALRPGYPSSAMIDLGVTTVDVTPIDVYPNPANDIINIDGITEATPFGIFTLEGRKMLDGTITATRTSVDVSNLASGVYLLKTRKTSTRLIIQ